MRIHTLKPSGLELSHQALDSTCLLTEDFLPFLVQGAFPSTSNQGSTGAGLKHEPLFLTPASPPARCPWQLQVTPGNRILQFHSCPQGFENSNRDLDECSWSHLSTFRRLMSTDTLQQEDGSWRTASVQRCKA